MELTRDLSEDFVVPTDASQSESDPRAKSKTEVKSQSEVAVVPGDEAIDSGTAETQVNIVVWI